MVALGYGTGQLRRPDACRRGEPTEQPPRFRQVPAGHTQTQGGMSASVQICAAKRTGRYRPSLINRYQMRLQRPAGGPKGHSYPLNGQLAKKAAHAVQQRGHLFARRALEYVAPVLRHAAGLPSIKYGYNISHGWACVKRRADGAWATRRAAQYHSRRFGPQTLCGEPVVLPPASRH